MYGTAPNLFLFIFALGAVIIWPENGRRRAKELARPRLIFLNIYLTDKCRDATVTAIYRTYNFEADQERLVDKAPSKTQPVRNGALHPLPTCA